MINGELDYSQLRYRLVKTLAVAIGLAPVAAITTESDASLDRNRLLRFGKVEIVSDEADAALRILETRSSGRAVAASDWNALFATKGYRDLRRREEAMGRAFTDSSFEAFLLADSMAARASALARGVDQYRRLDVTAALRKAVAYLPPGTPVRARLYPLIKPRPNSFVFMVDSVMGIFKFVDPAEEPALIENVLAHELHHVGYAAACQQHTDSTLPPAVRTLLVRLGGFGEGLAMLAAAGGPLVYPQITQDTAVRNRWNRDVENVPSDMRRLEAFFLDVLEGRVGSSDSVNAIAQTSTVYKALGIPLVGEWEPPLKRRLDGNA